MFSIHITHHDYGNITFMPRQELIVPFFDGTDGFGCIRCMANDEATLKVALPQIYNQQTRGGTQYSDQFRVDKLGDPLNPR
eukprot:2420161-Karenia_brevis.AAC.1